jgi:ribosome-binding protein aMBF1 (putative translation factor)
VNKTLGSERHDALIAFLINRRKAAGLSQSKLAKRMGEYQSFVARMESGQRRVDVVEFLALAELLGFCATEALHEIEKSITKKSTKRASK